MYRISRPAGLLLALASSSVMAGSSIGDMFSYSGFGTVGVVRTNTDKAEYVESGQTVGAKDTLYFNTDSNLGLQGSFTPTSWVSATVQALAINRFNDSIAPQFEWAFIKFKPVSGLSIRVGQMALPSYLVSDSRHVGYANTWLRAPDEVYGQGVFDTYKGVDVTYQHSIGKYSVTVSGLAGKAAADYLYGPQTALIVNGRNVRGYSAMLDADFATLRVSHVKADVDAILGNFILGKAFYTFSSIAATYDRDNVVGQVEFVQKNSGSTQFDYHGWYTLGGYHIGAWLPYAIYAAGQQPTGPSSPPGPIVRLPSLSKHTVSLGVRADLIKSMDFKLQVDRETTYPNGNPFINVQPGFDNKAYVYSLAVDFVF
jgi:hypothetical protein